MFSFPQKEPYDNRRSGCVSTRSELLSLKKIRISFYIVNGITIKIDKWNKYMDGIAEINKQSKY